MLPKEEESLNFDNLPSDIIRKIIKVGQESIDDMKMVSRRWNSLSLSHLTLRTRLPSINSIEWNVDYEGLHLTIDIMDRFRNYFGLDSWEWRPITDASVFTVSRATKFYESNRPHLDILSKRNYNARRNLWQHFARLISRCSRIKKLATLQSRHSASALNPRERDLLDSIMAAMNGVIVDELSIHGCLYSKRTEPIVLDALRTNTVHRLVLIPCTRYLPISTVSFLVDASRLVPSIEINDRLDLIYPDEWDVHRKMNDSLNSTGFVTATIDEEDLHNGECLLRMTVAKRETPQNDRTEDLVESETVTSPLIANWRPREELLDHQRKRQIELKVAEYEMRMEDEGHEQSEINKKVADYRRLLLSQLESGELNVDEEISRQEKERRSQFKKEHAMNEAHCNKNSESHTRFINEGINAKRRKRR